MAGTTISFDGNDLQTTTIFTSDIEHENTPQKNLNMAALAHANLSTIPFVNYPQRSVTLYGTVVGSSVSDLDTKLDTFRGYFRGTDKNLDIGYGGSTRRYIATANAITIKRPGGLSFASFIVEMVCSEPFGKATSTTAAVTAAAATAQPRADAYTFLGSAPWQQPIFSVTISALTGGTNAYIGVGNSATGQEIRVTRTWAAADVLVVNTITKSVTVNGNEVDFTGAFPEFEPGAGTIDYTDSFTTRTFDYSVTYYKRYL